MDFSGDKRERLLSALVHASQCDAENCQDSSCSHMQTLLRHILKCQMRDCVICRDMGALLREHGKSCSQFRCPVINCATYRFLLGQQCSLNVVDVLHDLYRIPSGMETCRPTCMGREYPPDRDMRATRQPSFIAPRLEISGRANTSSTISSDSSDEFLLNSVPVRPNPAESMIFLPKHREKRTAQRQPKFRRRRKTLSIRSRDLESKSTSDSTDNCARGKLKRTESSSRSQASSEDIDRVRVCDLPSRIGSSRSHLFAMDCTVPLPSSQHIAAPASSSPISSSRREDEDADVDSDSSISCWGSPSRLLPSEAWGDLEYDANPLSAEPSLSLGEAILSRSQSMRYSTPPRTPPRPSTAAAGLWIGKEAMAGEAGTGMGDKAVPSPTATAKTTPATSDPPLASPMAEEDMEPLEMTFSHLSIEVGDLSIEHCFSGDDDLLPPYYIGVTGVDSGDLNTSL